MPLKRTRLGKRTEVPFRGRYLRKPLIFQLADPRTKTLGNFKKFKEAQERLTKKPSSKPTRRPARVLKIRVEWARAQTA